MKKLIYILAVLVILTNINYAQDSTEVKACTPSIADSVNCDSLTVETVKPTTPWNKICPVMGNPVSDTAPTYYYDGKLWGFCCAGCDEKFAKNPQKYIKNLNEAGTKFRGKR
jgi:YHS domain-containing protein